ncbi:hypothetical protein [Pontixanthobacter sp.]|uniref:hypothetical protein n=1 Tax=Pontixanthobacter sp. TaxID=2792078 RepID=UPI003C7A1AB8
MIRRRVLAAILLLTFAIGAPLFWNGGTVNTVPIATNIALACAGMVLLHFRWRAQEQAELTPRKAKDIFK